MSNEPRLYVIVRSDLPSLRGLKAAAHAAHAASQFAFESVDAPPPGYHRWEESTPLGFGTTIALGATHAQLKDVYRFAQSFGLASGLTVDPSYPFIVDNEIGRLIKHPEEYPPIYNSDGKTMTCFREETTAGYVFGTKKQTEGFLKSLPMTLGDE